MTDKQIIIDASKCEWRTGVEHCGNYECMLNKCCDYNCDWYKRRKLEQQLKAKDQECEELKEGYSELTDIVSSYMDDFTGYNEELGGFDIVLCVKELMEQLDQLKAENDGLKTMLKDLSYENQKFCYQIEEQTKQLEPFKDEYFKGLDNVAIAKLAKKSIRITAENSKLEQTLIEIKEIVENMNEECFYDDFDCMNCDMQNGCTYFNKKQILQKISEVENDNK